MVNRNNRRFPVKTIIASILLLSVPVAFAGVLFSDDFNDGDDDGWSHYGGAGFDVSAGVYYIYSNGTGVRGISYSGDSGGQMSMADYSMAARVYFDAGNTAGIAARYSDSGEWFYVLVLSRITDEVILGRGKSNGGLIPLDAVPMVISPDFHCWMRLEVSGTSLGGKVWTGSLEDEPEEWLVLADDSTQPGPGSVALFITGPYASGNVTWTCGFDDVEVSDELTLILDQGSWGAIKSLLLLP
jgi:hypothetical protein